MALDPITGLVLGSHSRTGGALLDGLYQPPKANYTPGPVAAAAPAGGTIAPGDPLASPTAPAPVHAVRNLQSLIENDPLYKQTAADVAASRIASRAQLSAARQRALTMYGETPDLSGANQALVGDIASDINGTVQQLAQQNTAAGLSTVGRLGQAYHDNVKALQDSLAARGILSSGETGYQLGRQNTQYQQSKYDALQQLLDLLANYQGSFLSNEGQLRQLLSGAAQGAAGRIPLDEASAGSTDAAQAAAAAPAAPPPASYGPDSSDVVSRYLNNILSGGGGGGSARRSVAS